MADARNLQRGDKHTEAWQDKPWKHFQRVVFRLQKRIYRAQQRHDRRTVHKLQRLLLASSAARHLAVRRVTQENRGKRTAGVDGVASLRPPERLQLASALRDLSGQADPIRRVYIPKPGKAEQRPLGIPTMADRARQTLVTLALEPEWEAQFEPNSYGFRPGRSTHDAIGAIFLSMKHTPQYVLKADIEQCFDRIDHAYLLAKLNTFPRLRRLIKSWLKAGIMEGAILTPSRAGTPQGGPASPLLANVALHGLEEELCRSVPRRKHGRNWQPTVVRYADDALILHRDLETLMVLHDRAEGWLQHVGLRFKPRKTRISHTLHTHQGNVGCDFLGFNIRQYPIGRYRSGKNGAGQLLGFKTLITPSRDAQKRHLQRTGTLIRRYRGTSQEALIKTLGPVITGWSRYYAHVAAKAVFVKMYHRVHHQLRRWAYWRHHNKGYRWRMHRYWQRKDGRIVFGKSRTLPRHPETPITRHAKVAGTRSPYDGDWAYWGLRLRRYAGLSPQEQKLLRVQSGKCGWCGLYFTAKDRMEVHHRDRDRTNHWFTNLMLLHRHCHDTVPSTHDKGHQVEKLHDRKRSRAVLQRQGAEQSAS
jgi:RNA-directed DNA polymerase